MEYPSRLLSRVNPKTAPYASRQLHRDDSGGWPPSVYSDLNLARILEANVLVVGLERQVTNLVNLLVADRSPNVVISCQDGPLRLPPATSRLGIVVFRDVESLEQDEQRRLFEWLDSANNRRQVISTASMPLLSLVEAGAFNKWLYYRLNTVYIELSE